MKHWKDWNIKLKIGIIILIIFVLLGFIGPLLSDGRVTELSRYMNNLKPSKDHILGTTGQGQDTFFLLCYSIRYSFLLGICVAIGATFIGVLAGLLAGFLGGLPDRIIMLIADAFFVIPSLPILILLSALTKGKGSLVMVGVVLIVFNWPWPARQVRSLALTMKERDFINTERFSGESTLSILGKEIFPFVKDWSFGNLINTVLVAISSESGLAVIGMSSSTTATLGNMIYWAIQHQALLGRRWLWIGSPVLSIILIFIGLYLFMTGQQEYSALRRGK